MEIHCSSLKVCALLSVFYDLIKHVLLKTGKFCPPLARLQLMSFYCFPGLLRLLKWNEVMTSSTDEGKSFAYIFLFVCFSYKEMLILILESLFAFLK